MSGSEIDIYLTHEDAMAYMRDKNKSLIYQMSFSFTESLNFKKKAKLVFEDDLSLARLKRKLKTNKN